MAKTQNLEKLKPGQLLTLLNSSASGMFNERTLKRLRDRAGLAISDDGGTTVNLFKFTAWLFDRRVEKLRMSQESPSPARTYDDIKEAARKRNADASKAGRDIADPEKYPDSNGLPPVVNPTRKEACRRDYRLFCESYFPETYYIPWSDDHLKVISKVEKSTIEGGLFAEAMPRGSGKSCLAETAALWATFYGYHEFIILIGATETAALEILDSIKTEIETNDLLMDDFPEICHPIRALEGIVNRCSGQLCNGLRTRISWTTREIILPNVSGSPASGAIIRVGGITGRVRGMKFKRPDGKTVRPSLVIVDDPQTKESAASIEQTRKRLAIINGDILGLAGPGRKISGIMPCTVIEPGDLADQVLDRQSHPEWNGERCKMIYRFPENEPLWNKYAEIRADSLRLHGDIRDATSFYRDNRTAMDAGALAAWPQRHNPDELSAIQHAMNLKLQDEAAFFAEYQNEPLPLDQDEGEQLTLESITAKINGLPRETVPVGCDFLTAFVDVQGKMLFYTVVAWDQHFTGAIVDYGSYPDQKRRLFSLADSRVTLKHKHPGAGFEGTIYAGLEALMDSLLSREFLRDDGAAMKVSRALIDANWGQSTDIIYQFCREYKHAALLFPSHGRYVGASSKSMTEYRKQPGDRVGHNWYIPNVRGKRATRHVTYDTNYWKSFIRSRFFVARGDSGGLSIFGRKPQLHELFASHCVAEYSVRVESRGREVDEWKLRPEKADNHWWDCLVGCAVAASIEGATLPGTNGAEKRRSRTSRTSSTNRLKLSDLQRQRRN